MAREMKQASEPGIEISLQIPARDADLFKNKSTNDLLLFLSRYRFEEFTIRELATHTEHPKTTVNRAIDILERNDLVVSEPSGSRRSVRINRERLSVPDDPTMQIPQTEFHAPVRAAVQQIEATVDDLLAIVLYGSVARGQADRRSDIDLWVLVQENRSEYQREINEIELDLEEMDWRGDRYSYHIDVEEVHSIPTYTNDIRDIIMSGIPLYKTEEFRTIKNLLFNEVNEGE